jgi:hypothetical protein
MDYDVPNSVAITDMRLHTNRFAISRHKFLIIFGENDATFLFICVNNYEK